MEDDKTFALDAADTLLLLSEPIAEFVVSPVENQETPTAPSDLSWKDFSPVSQRIKIKIPPHMRNPINSPQAPTMSQVVRRSTRLSQQSPKSPKPPGLSAKDDDSTSSIGLVRRSLRLSQQSPSQKAGVPVRIRQQKKKTVKSAASTALARLSPVPERGNKENETAPTKTKEGKETAVTEVEAPTNGDHGCENTAVKSVSVAAVAAAATASSSHSETSK